MQQQLEAAQAELADTEVTGTAGGGLVTATVTGSGELTVAHHRPEAVDPDDVETLQDLVVAAVRDAAERRRAGPRKMGPLAGAGRPRHSRLVSLRRASPDVTAADDVRGRRPGPHRRARPAARRRPEERAAHRLPPAGGRIRRRRAAGLDADAGQERGAVLPRSAATSPRPSSAASALDPRRDPTVICVVEEPKDVVAVERTREFRGRYHVLGGAISPIDGVGPDDLRIRELMPGWPDGTSPS